MMMTALVDGDLQMDDALTDVFSYEHVGKSFDLFLVHGFAQVFLGADVLVGAHGEIAWCVKESISRD